MKYPAQQAPRPKEAAANSTWLKEIVKTVCIDFCNGSMVSRYWDACAMII
jgi:hypothetical protein